MDKLHIGGASGTDHFVPQTFQYIKSELMVPVHLVLDAIRAGRPTEGGVGVRPSSKVGRAVGEVAEMQERNEFLGRPQDMLQKKSLLHAAAALQAGWSPLKCGSSSRY